MMVRFHVLQLPKVGIFTINENAENQTLINHEYVYRALPLLPNPQYVPVVLFG
jgi:hypothetical protein